MKNWSIKRLLFLNGAFAVCLVLIVGAVGFFAKAELETVIKQLEVNNQIVSQQTNAKTPRAPGSADKSKEIVAYANSVMSLVDQLMLASVLVAMVLLVFLATYISKSVTAPIDTLVQTLNRVASQSDLTVRVPVNRDDQLGLAMRSFNALMDSFQGIVRDVRHVSHNLTDNSQGLAEAANQSLNSAQTNSDASASAAAAVEELSSSIAGMFHQAQSAKNASRGSLDLSRNGETLVGQSAKQMEDILVSVRQSADSVLSLEARATEISQITGVIRGIADQTNLLALNAAIEAARAGEGGRGFAVVADEVRHLAERTSQATDQINSMIATIQSGTRDAAQSMNEGVDRVSCGVQLTQSVGDSIVQAAKQANDACEAVSHIAESLKEQGDTSFAIGQTVERVAQVSEAGQAIAQETAQRSKVLAEMAFVLDEKVARFKL